MNPTLQQKLAGVLPDAMDELETKKAAYQEALDVLRRAESEFRSAADLVETLRQHGAGSGKPSTPNSLGGPQTELDVGSEQPRLDQGDSKVLPRGAQRARVLRVVNEAGGPISIGEVADRVGDDRNRIGAALWKAAQLDLIQRLDDGRYAPNPTSQTDEAR